MRFEKKLFSELADIYTEKQFSKLDRENLFDSSVVAVPPIIYRGGRCADMLKSELGKGGVAIISNKLLPSFILFLLNTAPCLVELFDRKFNTLTKIAVSKKKISQLAIPVVDLNLQKSYAMAESLHKEVYDYAHERTEDEKWSYVYGLIDSLCNSLAIDLFTAPFLEEKGVDLLIHWEQTIKEYNDKEDFSVIMDALTKSDSPLRNDIIKLQLVISNLKKD